MQQCLLMKRVHITGNTSDRLGISSGVTLSDKGVKA